MPDEMSKSCKRRLRDPWWQQVFRGRGLDIGAGSDGFSRHAWKWPKVISVRDWDMPDGDAQTLPGVPDCSYDFVVSSHCLEHLHDPYAALVRWLEVTKPGGHVVVTVPDADLYEKGLWPSRFNPDHKRRFTLDYVLAESRLPDMVDVADLLYRVTAVQPHAVGFVGQIRVPYPDNLPEDVDATSLPDVEAAIEFVLRKSPRE